MLLIVKDASTHSVEVFNATPEQVKSFNEADYLSASVMGWPVESPEQLAATSLTREDLAKMHNSQNPMDGRFIVGEKTKREIARMIFDGLPKIAKPYNMTPATSDKTPATAKPKAATPPRASKRLSRDNEWETAPTKLIPQREGGCTAKLIDALSAGATLAQLQIIVPNWQPTSILSALQTDVLGKAGYGVKKTKAGDDFVYTLVYPEGVTKPLPHIAKAKK